MRTIDASNQATLKGAASSCYAEAAVAWAIESGRRQNLSLRMAQRPVHAADRRLFEQAAQSRGGGGVDLGHWPHMVGTFGPSALLLASCLREISANWQNRSAQRPTKCAVSRRRFGFARTEAES